MLAVEPLSFEARGERAREVRVDAFCAREPLRAALGDERADRPRARSRRGLVGARHRELDAVATPGDAAPHPQQAAA